MGFSALAPIARWKEVLRRARRRGEFIGVDEESHPRDFAVLPHFHHALVKTLRSRYPLPPPVDLDMVDRFLENFSTANEDLTVMARG